MSASSKGSARERQERKRWEDEDWVVVRSAASASPVDLWAMRIYFETIAGTPEMVENWPEQRRAYPLAEVRAIQVKANRGSPWMNFRKQEREELMKIAVDAGAIPLLVHWPPNGERVVYGYSEWPPLTSV